MAEFISDANRKLIPRWRSSESTLVVGEMFIPTGQNRPVSPDEDFAEKIEHWQERPTVSSAAELLAAGLVYSRLDEARDAAAFLVRYGQSAPRFLYLAAVRAADPFDFRDPDDFQTQREQIHTERKMLSLEPRNPFKWVDLARNYLLIGKPQKSRRAMAVALQLAPHDRFTLRSAVRLYLHLKDPERAHHLLSTNQVVPYDPTLLAVEIAVSAILHRTSSLIKTGFAMLDADYPSTHLSELAAVLATEELERGPGRRARKLFRRSLIEPTENTVAQARWASTKGGPSFDPAYLRTPRSFEARAWNCFYEGDWSEALTQSKAWQGDQAFSRRPVSLGSFISAVALEDHAGAIALLQTGLFSNPTDPLLLNNLAYSLACNGQLLSAEQALQHMVIRADDPEYTSLMIVKNATAGLIRYRRGDPNGGLALYQRAYDDARAASLHNLKDRVMVFAALEHARSGSNFEQTHIPRVRQLAERSTDPVLQLLVSKLLKLLKLE